MKIIINGEPKEIAPDTDIITLMETLGYDKDIGAVAVNMTFVASDKYSQTILQEGDEVEILAPVCGG
jgi:sulfur carrier protein